MGIRESLGGYGSALSAQDPDSDIEVSPTASEMERERLMHLIGTWSPTPVEPLPTTGFNPAILAMCEPAQMTLPVPTLTHRLGIREHLDGVYETLEAMGMLFTKSPELSRSMLTSSIIARTARKESEKSMGYSYLALDSVGLPGQVFVWAVEMGHLKYVMSKSPAERQAQSPQVQGPSPEEDDNLRRAGVKTSEAMDNLRLCYKQVPYMGMTLLEKLNESHPSVSEMKCRRGFSSYLWYDYKWQIMFTVPVIALNAALPMAADSLLPLMHLGQFVPYCTATNAGEWTFNSVLSLLGGGKMAYVFDQGNLRG